MRPAHAEGGRGKGAGIMNVRFFVTGACALILVTASMSFAQARDGKVANAAGAAAGKTLDA